MENCGSIPRCHGHFSYLVGFFAMAAHICRASRVRVEGTLHVR